jgi:predicted nucleic acid-binding protein
MRTALDSNVISSLWSGEEWADRINRELVEARARGGLVMCAPVFAELMAHPLVKEGDRDRFLVETNIAVDFDLEEEVWRKAATGFLAYARRRRSSSGGLPKRLLVDYVIAAHALLRADRLMTLDARRYAQDFPGLRLVDL